MTQEEMLQDIVKRLERMEQGQQALRDDLTSFKQEMGVFQQDMGGFKQGVDGFKQEMTSFRQETADNFADLRKSVRGVKLKASKTWNLLHYFTRDADERIVKTARRVDAIEEHLGLAHKN